MEANESTIKLYYNTEVEKLAMPEYGRNVLKMVELMKVARKNIKREQHNAVPNGIIALKGGELAGEIASMKNICTVWELSDFFEEEYFKTKKVVHVTIVNKK